MSKHKIALAVYLAFFLALSGFEFSRGHTSDAIWDALGGVVVTGVLYFLHQHSEKRSREARTITVLPPPVQDAVKRSYVDRNIRGGYEPVETPTEEDGHA